jgi:hypothetical protein
MSFPDVAYISIEDKKEKNLFINDFPQSELDYDGNKIPKCFNCSSTFPTVISLQSHQGGCTSDNPKPALGVFAPRPMWSMLNRDSIKYKYSSYPYSFVRLKQIEYDNLCSSENMYPDLEDRLYKLLNPPLIKCSIL